jgi:hypothetical protein
MPNPFDYMKPTEANMPVVEATREAFKVLHAHLLTLPMCRENSVAITKLEECAMWAVKGVVFNQEVKVDTAPADIPAGSCSTKALGECEACQ